VELKLQKFPKQHPKPSPKSGKEQKKVAETAEICKTAPQTQPKSEKEQEKSS
jgi:hypothetical protein